MPAGVMALTRGKATNAAIAIIRPIGSIVIPSSIMDWPTELRRTGPERSAFPRMDFKLF